jgi:uncharacterized phiE125 gp8 family phage protein
MEHYRIKRTVQPTSEPITVAEAYAHCRIDSNAEEAYVSTLISTAREWLEDNNNTTLLTTTWALTLDRFPVRCGAKDPLDRERIELPRCPVQSITSIAYVDEDGASQTFSAASYSLDSSSNHHASVGPVYDEEWPDIREQVGAVTVTYVAGYTLAANVPPKYRHAMKLLIGHWYENRETTLIGTISKELEFTISALVGPTNLSSVG